MRWLWALLNPWNEVVVLRTDLDLARRLAEDNGRAASLLQAANTRLIEEVTSLRQDITGLHAQNHVLIVENETLRGGAPHGTA